MIAAPRSLPVEPSRPPTRLSRGLSVAGWLPVVVLAVAVLAVYQRFLDADFVGTDPLPAVQSSRIFSWSDVVGFWTQPLMAGTVFASEQALFYRPIASLSFALDYSLCGANPVGY